MEGRDAGGHAECTLVSMAVCTSTERSSRRGLTPSVSHWTGTLESRLHTGSTAKFYNHSAVWIATLAPVAARMDGSDSPTRAHGGVLLCDALRARTWPADAVAMVANSNSNPESHALAFVSLGMEYFIIF